MTSTRKPRIHHILIFIAPALFFYTVFMVWPLIDSIRLSFYAPDPDHVRQYLFVGLDNYRKLFSGSFSAAFGAAFSNTLKFIAIIMFLGNPIALLLANMIVAVGDRWARYYRTIIIIPTLMSVVLAGWVWQLMLNPLWGIIDDALRAIGLGTVIPTTGWLGTSGVALIITALVATWQFMGLPMLLFMASLVGIDEELIDSARVDGASSWAIFWYIKFPLILPVVGLVVILTIIINFPAFDIWQVMRPRDGLLLANYFYFAFADSRVDGAVVGSLMFSMVGMASLIYFLIFQRRLIRD